MEYKHPFKIFDTVETFCFYGKNISRRGFLLYLPKRNYLNNKEELYVTVKLLYKNRYIIEQQTVKLKSCKMVLTEKIDTDLVEYSLMSSYKKRAEITS